MKFQITKNDITIGVDSIEDLQNLLSLLGAFEKKPTTQIIQKNLDVKVPAIEEKKLYRFYQEILLTRRPMIKILKSLASTPVGLTDLELRNILNLPTNHGLSGAMAGISKKAEKVGLHMQDVIIKDQVKGEHGVSYRYRLTPAMIETILPELEKEVSKAIT